MPFVNVKVAGPLERSQKEAIAKGVAALLKEVCDKPEASTYTVIDEVPRENWKTGRPISAEGIILRPRRPSFTAHQSISKAPNGLTALLVIDHRGRPIEVEIRSGTGSPSIDRSLVASLYRWRAAGEKIDAVVEGETINITIHISFSR